MISERQLSLLRLDAADVAEAIRAGRATSLEVVESYLACSEARKAEIRAWAFLDPAYALQQAREADEHRRRGRPCGPLHGVPVGVTDLIDTRDMPTEDGTPLHAGRMPKRDATLVSLLRESGAVLAGKTATSPLGSDAAFSVRNPHAPDRAVSGPAGGSAAAIAAVMTPLAVTFGGDASIVDAASSCGVVGYVPTRGLISTTGMLPRSRHFDRAAVVARSVPGAAMLAEALMAFDAQDPMMRARATPRLVDLLATPLPFPPRFAFVDMRIASKALEETRQAVVESARMQEGQVVEIEMPALFPKAMDVRRTILESELAANLREAYERSAGRLDVALCETIERGRGHRAVDYLGALADMPLLCAAMDEVLREAHAIVVPTMSETLSGQEANALRAPWSACGAPTVTLPLLADDREMPLGVQLVGMPGDDARLLRVARWLTENAGEQS